MAFTAGSVIWQFIADRGPLMKEAKKTEKDMSILANKAGKTFETKFAAEKHGRKIGDGLIANMDKSLKAGLPKINKNFKSGLLAVKGLAIGTTALATAGVGLAGSLTFAAKKAFSFAREIERLALISGLSAERFQEVAYAASQFGIEGDKLGEIFRNVNDKFGDFFETGAGPLADFFENIAPKVGLTEEAFRGLSSEQALGKYVKALEDANVGQQGMTFYLEALASDATDLLPVFKNGGAALDLFSAKARQLGLVLENDAIAKAAKTDREMETLARTLKMGVTAALVDLAPLIQEVTEGLIELTPKVVGWAQAAIDGLNELSDRWRASPFGSGYSEGEAIPSTVKGIDKQVEDFERLRKAMLEVARLKERGFGYSEGALRKDPRLSVQNALNDRQAFGERLLGSSAFEAVKNDLDALNAEINRRVNENLEIRERLSEGGEGTDGAPLIGGSFSGLGNGTKPSSGLSETVKRDIAILKAGNKEYLDNLRGSLDAAKAAMVDTMTPLEAYRAELMAIEALELNPFNEQFGGQETIIRKQKDALVALASEAGQAETAYKVLGEAVAKGEIDLEGAAEVMGRINTELGIAEDRAAKAEEQARLELETQLALLDAQAIEIENRLILARLKGDSNDIERLERELELVREKSRLLFEGKSLGEADEEANEIVSDRNVAEVEGKLRDAFKGGFRAAIDDNFDDYLESRLNDAAANMFDDAIDTLFDALFGKDGLIGDLGGLFGDGKGDALAGFASSFAGFFAEGGRIPSGKSGIVGEGGGMKYAELIQGPATVTPLRDLQSYMPMHNPAEATRRPTAIHVLPSPYFDTVVDERAANVAEPIAQKNAVQAGASAQINFTKSQRRKLV